MPFIDRTHTQKPSQMSPSMSINRYPLVFCCFDSFFTINFDALAPISITGLVAPQSNVHIRAPHTQHATRLASVLLHTPSSVPPPQTLRPFNALLQRPSRFQMRSATTTNPPPRSDPRSPQCRKQISRGSRRPCSWAAPRRSSSDRAAPSSA